MNRHARALGPAARRDARRLPADTPLPAIYRQHFEQEVQSNDPLARSPEMATVEALLFLADEPLAPKKLAQAAGLDAATLRKVLRQLQDAYQQDRSPFEIEELAGGVQLFSRSEFHRWLSPLRRPEQEIHLSAAARETLAIVAYRQPITRADLEGIRGVNSTETLRLLMEKGFVRIAGRDDSLGRPVLYGTSKKFLQIFGLHSLKDLPRREQIG